MLPSGNSIWVIFAAYVVIREVIYAAQVQVLVNKIMSRNYHEYAYSKEVAKAQPKDQPRMSREDLGDPEDLNALNGFGIN